MDVKDAITIAKNYILDIFGPEGAFNVGLEEVQFDGDKGIWTVTIGFSRPWDRPTTQNVILQQPDKRTYKTVDINDSQQRVVAVRNRMVEAFRNTA